MMAFSSVIVTCLALSTAVATCCWCCNTTRTTLRNFSLQQLADNLITYKWLCSLTVSDKGGGKVSQENYVNIKIPWKALPYKTRKAHEVGLVCSEEGLHLASFKSNNKSKLYSARSSNQLVEQRASWEANSHSASQEITRLYTAASPQHRVPRYPQTYVPPLTWET
jgi:hypothetical protein